MNKPTNEELILKELKAIRNLLEGLTSKAQPQDTQVKPPVLVSKIMGLDEHHSDGSPLTEEDYDPTLKRYITR